MNRGKFRRDGNPFNDIAVLQENDKYKYKGNEQQRGNTNTNLKRHFTDKYILLHYSIPI